MCFRSLNHIYAQIIDDTEGRTLVAASTLDESLKGNWNPVEIKKLQTGWPFNCRKAREKGITKVVFDRAGYKYHGRVAALAEEPGKTAWNSKAKEEMDGFSE